MNFADSQTTGIYTTRISFVLVLQHSCEHFQKQAEYLSFQWFSCVLRIEFQTKSQVKTALQYLLVRDELRRMSLK